jgi:DNA-binding CsgD family transcriptional regulator/PAS domain-containing protein
MLASGNLTGAAGAVIAWRRRPAVDPVASGDPDLADMLIEVGRMVDAVRIGLFHVAAGSRIGERLASVRLCDDEEGDENDDSDLTAAIERALGDDADPAPPGVTVEMLAPRANDRVALAIIGAPAAAGDPVDRHLALIVPLLSHGLALWMRAQVERLLRENQRLVLDRMTTGIVIVDVDARIEFANHSARCILDDGVHLFDADGRLMLADVDRAMHLQVALRNLLSRPAQAAPAEPPIEMAIARAGGFPLLLSIHSLGTGPWRRCAVIHLTDADQEPCLPLEAIGGFFDLTAVERRLVEQLARGRTLTDAAAAMKLKEQTARTYLKQVFQKTGMRRQTDLVSAVLKASPLLLGA